MCGGEPLCDLSRNPANPSRLQRRFGLNQFFQALTADDFGHKEWRSVLGLATRFDPRQIGMLKAAQQFDSPSKLARDGLVGTEIRPKRVQAADLVDIEAAYPVCRGDAVRAGLRENDIPAGDQFSSGPRRILAVVHSKSRAVLWAALQPGREAPVTSWTDLTLHEFNRRLSL